MGPSVLTMPQYIDELFELAGENPRDHFNYQKLDPVFQYFFEDGTVIKTSSDANKLADELANKTTVSQASVFKFLQQAAMIFDLTNEVFLQRSLHQFRNYFNFQTLRGILKFHKIKAFNTMAKSNAALFQDAKAEAIFNRYASYNGSDPYQAPGTLNVIAHLELGLGAYYPNGGMHSITTSMQRLAERLNVEFQFNSKVDEILVTEKRVHGIRIGKEKREYDFVVSNSDVFKTYHQLLPGQKSPDRILNQPKSCSFIVFYWGIKKVFPKLGLHNMFMSKNPKEEYGFISKGKIYTDPSVYLYCSSKLNSGDAPPGCENWFVMVSVPHNTGQHWDKLIVEMKSNVLEKLNRQLDLRVEEYIECENVLEPRIIEALTSSAFGAVFGNSSNSKFAAFLRHANFSSNIQNLYFCGGSVHPGAGIPLCLLSAKIVGEMVGEG